MDIAKYGVTEDATKQILELTKNKRALERAAEKHVKEAQRVEEKENKRQTQQNREMKQLKSEIVCALDASDLISRANRSNGVSE